MAIKYELNLSIFDKGYTAYFGSDYPVKPSDVKKAAKNIVEKKAEMYHVVNVELRNLSAIKEQCIPVMVPVQQKETRAVLTFKGLLSLY